MVFLLIFLQFSHPVIFFVFITAQPCRVSKNTIKEKRLLFYLREKGRGGIGTSRNFEAPLEKLDLFTYQVIWISTICSINIIFQNIYLVHEITVRLKVEVVCKMCFMIFSKKKVFFSFSNGNNFIVLGFTQGKTKANRKRVKLNSPEGNHCWWHWRSLLSWRSFIGLSTRQKFDFSNHIPILLF